MAASAALSLLLLLLLLCCCRGEGSDPRVARVTVGPDGDLVVTEGGGGGGERGWVAMATFSDQINQTGWAYLEVRTAAGAADEVQAYGAGLVEGFLTRALIRQHWNNTVRDFCTGRQELCRRVQGFIDENQRWVDGKVARHNATDPYWYQVGLFYLQLRGLADGYLRGVDGPDLTFNDLLWLNLDGDLEDLTAVFGGEADRAPGKGDGHCSALVKLVPGSRDLYVSHVTWAGYNTMLRMQKLYRLGYRAGHGSPSAMPGSDMAFSSFPGGIQSGDDFFLISSGIVTMETTIGNGNASRWRFVRPTEQVLEVVRAMVANRLAVGGLTWAQLFSRYNSGTYNNQWMIVDYKLFKAGTPAAHLPAHLLWVLEQIPGYVHADDLTSVLRTQTYWPSYNVPYFRDVFLMSGQQEAVDKHGDWFSYERTPRALIFRRDHADVTDLTSMMALMRYNDFRHDPLSRCNCSPPYSAENAISARCDLNPPDGRYPFPALGHRSHGATDAKVTSRRLLKRLQMVAVAGPTHGGDLPPFRWSEADFRDTQPHEGHPDLWAFPPVIHSWDFHPPPGPLVACVPRPLTAPNLVVSSSSTLTNPAVTDLQDVQGLLQTF